MADRYCFREQPKRMWGTNCLNKNHQAPKRGNRKSRKRDWYVHRMTLNRVIVKMVLGPYQAVRMRRILDPHRRP